MELVIGYLVSSSRFFTFKNFCKSIKNIKNKIHIYILVLSHDEYMIQNYNNVIENVGLDNITVCNVPNENNYMLKIKKLIAFSQENNVKFTIKLDDDIIFHPSIIDYMYENRELIDNTNNLTLSPNLSTGIPTCDNFMKDFFTKEEQDEMKEMFKKHIFGKIWNVDYSFLNYPKEEWDSKLYHDTINAKEDVYYKGIHPLRVNNDIMKRYNEILLAHISEFSKKQVYYIYKYENDSYLCNSFFIIKTDSYFKVINHDPSYVDSYDEVRLNKYCVHQNMRKLYIGNSFTIHPWYNSYPNHQHMEQVMFDIVMQNSDANAFLDN